MRVTKEVLSRGAFAAAMGAGVIALGISHPLSLGAIALGSLAALLLPPALLALLLRVVKFRDRFAYFRPVRTTRLALTQAFPPAAFGNSSGGRNVS